MKSIQQLRSQRADKAREARKILDDAGDNFTYRHGKQIDALYAEIDRIDEQIAAMTRQADLDAYLDSPETVGAFRAERSGRSVDSETAMAARERKVFAKWLRNGQKGLTPDDMEFIRSRPRADQATEPGSAGGYTVPRDFQADLLERLKAFGGIRSVATEIRTTGGNPMDWPTVDETAEMGEIVAENQPASEGQITFGTVNLAAYKYSSKVVAVSFELLQDTGIDLVGFVNRALSTRIARITSEHFVNGTGVSQPHGCATTSPAIAQLAAGDISFDDLIELEHSVDPAYRNAPTVRFCFHDLTLKALQKVKDDVGRPIWLPGLSASYQSGSPDTILGYRYQVLQEMKAFADAVAGEKVVLFGDFSKYIIRDVMAATLFRFEDSQFIIKGQIGFLSWSRHDGDRIDVNFDAIKALTKA